MGGRRLDGLPSIFSNEHFKLTVSISWFAASDSSRWYSDVDPLTNEEKTENNMNTVLIIPPYTGLKAPLERQFNL